MSNEMANFAAGQTIKFRQKERKNSGKKEKLSKTSVQEKYKEIYLTKYNSLLTATTFA